MTTYLVTGASGFVGQALCAALRSSGGSLRLLTRNSSAPPGSTANDSVIRAEPGAATDWPRVMQGVDCVVHLAARTHVMRETAADPLAEYRRVNVDLTRDLARAAAAAGVRQFVFLSSIKVNGEVTHGAAFSEESAPHPQDYYGHTKWEAEQVLAAESGVASVILRPPLVYGPGVRGNFLRLMRAVARGLPLPLGAVANRRSLVYLGNLVDAIVICATQAAAAGRTYLIADDAVSTPDLVRHLAVALGKPARLLNVPPPVLKLAGAITGKTDAMARLTGSLVVDSALIRRELGWHPRCTMAQGLGETARWYYRAADAPQTH
ncbi:MAG: SDR family oxidoreductase [Burkholderiales bacterium]